MQWDVMKASRWQPLQNRTNVHSEVQFHCFLIAAAATAAVARAGNHK